MQMKPVIVVVVVTETASIVTWKTLHEYFSQAKRLTLSSAKQWKTKMNSPLKKQEKKTNISNITPSYTNNFHWWETLPHPDDTALQTE